MKKLLILFLLYGLCYGQEVLTPSGLPKSGTSPAIDYKQFELDRLTVEKQAIEAKLSEIAEAPLKHAQDKVKRLDEWIPKLPDRTAKEGRITMKEHLTNIRNEIQVNPAAYTQKEVERLLTNKARVEARMETLSKEVTNAKLIEEK